MSNITLSANAGGSGIFTIASPNSNTNRTLTLPDVTGTFNVSGAATEVPSGSASTPSIYPTGDTNTGIFFPAADTIAFTEGGVESVRIDSSGNFLVGTTSNLGSSRFAVVGNVSNHMVSFRNDNNSTPSGLDIIYNAAAPNNTTNTFCQGRDTSAVRFEFRSNGGLANFSGNNVNLSDRREKTNFAPAGEWLPKICAIPVQTFNYADQNLEEDPGLTLGVVAQDVQAVAPELVMESNWGTQDDPKMRLSIYQTDLQYALMKCIQEQQALINSLTARMDAQAAEIAALKGAA
jgi:hypothetical protein